MTLSYKNVTWTIVPRWKISKQLFPFKKTHQTQQPEHNQLTSQKVIWEFTSDSTPRKPPQLYTRISQTLNILYHCTAASSAIKTHVGQV